MTSRAASSTRCSCGRRAERDELRRAPASVALGELARTPRERASGTLRVARERHEVIDVRAAPRLVRLDDERAVQRHARGALRAREPGARVVRARRPPRRDRSSASPARIHSSGESLKSQWLSSRTNGALASASRPHVARRVLATVEADHDLLALDDREQVHRPLPHAHEALHAPRARSRRGGRRPGDRA